MIIGNNIRLIVVIIVKDICSVFSDAMLNLIFVGKILTDLLIFE